MASNITLILDTVKVQAGAIAGIGAARVYQGRKRFQESDNFESSIHALTPESQGYLEIWIGPRRVLSQTEVGTVEIHGTLFCNMTKDVSSTTDTLFDFVESVVNNVMQVQAYYGIGSRPISCLWQEHEDDALQESFVAFDIVWTFECGIISNPE